LSVKLKFANRITIDRAAAGIYVTILISPHVKTVIAVIQIVLMTFMK